MGFPITRVDAKTGTITGQWHGAGGDSIRYAMGQSGSRIFVRVR